MKRHIKAFMAISLFLGFTTTFSSCGTIKYKEARNVNVIGDPGTNFYLVNQKEKGNHSHQVDEIMSYNKKGIIIHIGSIDTDGKGVLTLSTKEYKRSKKYVYAVKEGTTPTRFKLGRKFNALMLADIAPIIMLFDQARIINEKNSYQIITNYRSELQAFKAEDPEKELRKQKRSQKWDKALKGMMLVGNTLEAVGNALNSQTTTPTQTYASEEIPNDYSYTAGNPSVINTGSSNKDAAQSNYNFNNQKIVYEHWARQAKTAFDSITKLGIKTEGSHTAVGVAGGPEKLSGTKYTIMCRYLLEAQQNMRNIRIKAKKHGYHIEQSKYETAQVGY